MNVMIAAGSLGTVSQFIWIAFGRGGGDGDAREASLVDLNIIKCKRRNIMLMRSPELNLRWFRKDGVLLCHFLEF